MNIKQAKDRLESAYWLENRINSKLMQIETMRTLAEKVTPVLSDMPRGGSTTNKVEDMAIKIADLDARIINDINILMDTRALLYQEINDLPNAELSTILEMRYLNHFTWEDIASAIHTSTRNVHNKHGRALQLFAEIHSKL